MMHYHSFHCIDLPKVKDSNKIFLFNFESERPSPLSRGLSFSTEMFLANAALEGTRALSIIKN